MKANVRIIKENIVILDKDDISDIEDCFATLDFIAVWMDSRKEKADLELVEKSKAYLCDILKVLKHPSESVNETDAIDTHILKVDAHANTLVNGEKILTGLESRFYATLPEEFTTQEYFEIADRLNILRKTAEKWMRKFVDNYCIVTRYKQGHYHKVFKTFTKTEVFIGNKKK